MSGDEAGTRRRGLTTAEVEELRRSVAALRGAIDTRFPSRTRRLPEQRTAVEWLDDLANGVRTRLADVDPSELVGGLRRILATFWKETSEAEVDEFGFDSSYLESVRAPLDFLYTRWWRVQVSGLSDLPAGERLLFVANRSGILPYDGLMIAHAVERAGYRPRPRFLVADWLVTLPFSQPRLARLGAARACPENVERLLQTGHSVVVFPEGQKGALKHFRDRYRLQRFARGGFVSLALRLHATVVPVAVVGAEEAHPILFRPGLARRLLGVPLAITPTFPLLGPLGLIPLPSQWRIRFGEPIRWDDAARARADDALFVNRTRDAIRTTIQGLVEEEVHRRSGVFSA